MITRDPNKEISNREFMTPTEEEKETDIGLVAIGTSVKDEIHTAIKETMNKMEPEKCPNCEELKPSSLVRLSDSKCSFCGKQIEQIEVTALGIQIGGDHYKHFPIQPIEFITKNNLSFLQGCIVKRILRYNLPGGKGKEDLLKCKHEIDLLLELSA